MATRAVPWLVGIVPDDAFYYLQVARHLAASGRSTFDGIEPTNGYHPAWMLACTAWATVVRDPAGLLRAAVGTALALHLATSLLLVRLLRPLAGRWWAWVAGAAWLGNPMPQLLALQAMETSLALFVVVAFAIVYAGRVLPRLRSGPFALPARDAVLLGLAAGAMAWARLDTLLLAAVALGAPVVARAISRSPREGARAAARLALAGLVALATIAPWWVYSWSVVGTPVQDSAAMKTLWSAAAGFSAMQRLARGFAVVLGGIDGAVRYLTGDLSGFARAWEAVGVVVVVGAALRARGGRPRRLRALVAVLGIAVVLMLAAYGAMLADIQAWYLGLPALVSWLAVTSALAVLAPRGRPALAAGAAVLAVSLFLFGRAWADPLVPYPWQRDVLRSVPVFEALVPPGARLGCFNAGIPAYFGHRTVIGLDGLVNHTVVGYWRARRFDRYLADADIAYIADEEGVLRRAGRFCSAEPALEPLATVPLEGWRTGRRLLWKVEAAPSATEAPE